MSDTTECIHHDSLQREANTSEEKQEQYIDQNTTSREQHNHFSQAQTTFYPSDAPSEKEQEYNRLKQWHNNKWSPDRRDELNEAMMMQDADTFGDILCMSDTQIQRVKDIIRSNDVSSNKYGGKSYEKLIIAVATLIVDEQARTLEERLVNREKFDDVMELLEMDRSELWSLRERVRENMSFLDDDS